MLGLMALFGLFPWGCDGGETETDAVTHPPTLDQGLKDQSPELDLEAQDQKSEEELLEIGLLDATLPEDRSLDQGTPLDLPGPDARPPLRPEHLPLEGALLPGAEDLSIPVSEGQARAGQVDQEEEALQGPQARCRPGCFRLDNARVSFCIEDEYTSSQMTWQGGKLIDAHLADRPGTDLLEELFLMPSWGEVSVEHIGILLDGSEGGAAVVQTQGEILINRTVATVLAALDLPKARIITEFRLEPDVDYLEISSWMEVIGVRLNIPLKELLLFGDRTLGLAPGGDFNGAQSGLPFLAADGLGTAYALSRNGDTVDSAPLLVIDPPLPGASYGNFSLLHGDMVQVSRRFYVGTDVESVRPAPEGAHSFSLEGPLGLRVEIQDEEGAVTRAWLETGQRELQLLPGEYRAIYINWPGGEGSQEFSVEGPGSLRLEPPEPAHLHIELQDDQGQGIAAKLHFRGPKELFRFIIDEADLLLPAGEWRLVTTRGWHYSMDERFLNLEPGSEQHLSLSLEELIPFEGWTSGEFHQHAAPSLDSELPEEIRVRSNLAEGLGFMVPSDHDIIFDYAGFVEKMGLSGRIATPITGVEVSSPLAHFGAYGIPYNPRQSGGGAPALATPERTHYRVRSVAELISAAREAAAEIIQLNHPRGNSGLFDVVDLDLNEPLSGIQSPHWSTDFDTVEVYNGQNDFCAVLQDWMGLLNQGLRITGVGNSDTHSDSDAAGYPRNYLPTTAEQPQGVTGAEVVEALRGGHLFVGGGAYMDFPDGPQPGERISLEEERFELRVRLRTPTFTRVERIIAFLNGQMVLDRSFEVEREALLDFDELLEIPVEREGHLIILALGDPQMLYVEDEPVFAFSNPIWLDLGAAGIEPLGLGVLELPEMSICR